MKRWDHRQQKTDSFAILASLGAFLISFIVFSLILALIAYVTEDPGALSGAFSVIALMLSSLTMGITLSLTARDGGIKICAICSLLEALVMLIAELCLNRFRISTPFIINVICAVGVTLITAKVVRMRGHRRKRIKRI